MKQLELSGIAAMIQASLFLIGLAFLLLVLIGLGILAVAAAEILLTRSGRLIERLRDDGA